VNRVAFAFGAVALVLGGCNRTVGTLFLSFVTSPKTNERPLPEDAALDDLTIEVRVEGPGIGVRRESFAASEDDLVVPGVDVGRDRIFTVTARNVGGDDIARARSLPQDVTGDDDSLLMYFALVGRSSEAYSRMRAPRFRHTATPLPDGRVLIAGGGSRKVLDALADPIIGDSFVVAADPVTYAEIFDPTRGSIVTNPVACVEGLPQPLCLFCPRMTHVAGVDLDGSPLLAAGEWGERNCRSPVERFSQGRFEPGTNTALSLAEAAAFPTPEGVVVAGGLDLIDGTPSSRAALVGGDGEHELDSGLWRARYAASAAPLPAGGGVVLGGFISRPPLGTPPDCSCVDDERPPDDPCSRTDCRTRGLSEADATDSIEVYDPGSRTFEELGATLTAPRAYATATALPDGRVVIVGGLGNIGTVGGQKLPVTSIEIFDPARGEACEVGQLLIGRWMHAAFATNDGRLVLTGGYEGDAGVVSETITVIPIRSGCSPIGLVDFVPEGLSLRRAGHTATPLANGAVLLAGGVTGDGSVTDTLDVLWLE
jgi:hypothetical protein